MSGLALLMAGGRGSRMIRSGCEDPKPLVKLGGVTLVERNLQQLLKHGFDQVFISIDPAHDQLLQFVNQTLIPLANSFDCALETIIEDRPLGNIGSARLIGKFEQPTLVVYADNVTSIDLRAVYEFHANQKCEMTIAAHSESFRMPFGEVRIQGDAVLEYDEKPEREFVVCSAVSVLGPTAIQSIPSDTSFGISDLVQSLLSNGYRVSAFRHNAPWIDVNDKASLLRAEEMVREHAREFEQWAPGTAKES